MKDEAGTNEIANESNKNKPSMTNISPMKHKDNTGSEAHDKHDEMIKVVKTSSPASLCGSRYMMVWARHYNEDRQNKTNVKEVKQKKKPGPKQILRYSII